LSCEFGCAPLVERGPTQVAVSLAHRLDTVVCAVSTTPIGIDIEVERQRPFQDPDGRAKIMLAPAEASAYWRTPLPQRAALLLALWVLKEAWTKSLGLQLQLSLLAHICASPAAPNAANARTWTAGKLTLGLVCQDPAALAHVNVTDLAPNSASEDWLVEAV
jgi:phosphopantetheinyl transferase